MRTILLFLLRASLPAPLIEPAIDVRIRERNWSLVSPRKFYEFGAAVTRSSLKGPLKDADFESVVIPLRVRLLRDTIRAARGRRGQGGGTCWLQHDSGVVGDNEPANFRSSANTISICF